MIINHLCYNKCFTGHRTINFVQRSAQNTMFSGAIRCTLPILSLLTGTHKSRLHFKSLMVQRMTCPYKVPLCHWIEHRIEIIWLNLIITPTNLTSLLRLSSPMLQGVQLCQFLPLAQWYLYCPHHQGYPGHPDLQLCPIWENNNKWLHCGEKLAVCVCRSLLILKRALIGTGGTN